MQHTNIASLIQKILNKKTKKTEEFLRPLLLRCSRSKIDQFLLLRCQKRRSIPIVYFKDDIIGCTENLIHIQYTVWSKWCYQRSFQMKQNSLLHIDLKFMVIFVFQCPVSPKFAKNYKIKFLAGNLSSFSKFFESKHNCCYRCYYLQWILRKLVLLKYVS